MTRAEETKAQLHLYQLGVLAVVLNRTLVLPNVRDSRLGMCHDRPFSFYYDVTSLSRLGVETVTQAEFLAWTAAKDKRPTAQVVVLTRGDGHFSPLIEINSASSVPPPGLCVEEIRLDFRNHFPITLLAPDNYPTQRSDD